MTPEVYNRMTVPAVLNGESMGRKAEYRYKKASNHSHKIF